MKEKAAAAAAAAVAENKKQAKNIEKSQMAIVLERKAHQKDRARA